METQMEPEDFCFVSDGAKYWLGRVEGIVALEVSENYTMVSLSNGQRLSVRGSLGKWEARLPGALFFRTGREALVNLAYVRGMRAFDAKRLVFILPGDREIVLSRAQSILFRKLKNL